MGGTNYDRSDGTFAQNFVCARMETIFPSRSQVSQNLSRTCSQKSTGLQK